jgi:hypothetical protein
MRKIATLFGVVVALAIPAAALAATLDTGKFTDFINEGDKCPKGAFYHIVHPGPDGGDDGTVSVVFSDGATPIPNLTTVTEASYQSPGKTTHYLVFNTGHLVSAEDDIAAGKLVISGYACKK